MPKTKSVRNKFLNRPRSLDARLVKKVVGQAKKMHPKKSDTNVVPTSVEKPRIKWANDLEEVYYYEQDEATNSSQVVVKTPFEPKGILSNPISESDSDTDSMLSSDDDSSSDGSTCDASHPPSKSSSKEVPKVKAKRTKSAVKKNRSKKGGKRKKFKKPFKFASDKLIRIYGVKGVALL